jgi:ribosomal protein L7Ae-like RNA K-turn-binding protein
LLNNKIFSYVGFAKRALKLKAGTNAIKTVKKGVYLLMVCETASQNALKEALKLSERFGCPIYKSCGFTLENLINKENCKLVAILEPELAKAIILNAGEDLIDISGGINE